MDLKHSVTVLGAGVLCTTGLACAQEPAVDSSRVPVTETAQVDTAPSPDRPGRPVLLIKDESDTVFILNAGSPSQVVEEVRRSMELSRRKGYGFGGGPLIGAGAINLEPIQDLIDNVEQLRGRDFGFSSHQYEPFLLRGGVGYMGVGNGVRLGGTGMGGSRRYLSQRRSNEAQRVCLDVTVGHGGFMVEKAMVFDRLTATAGGVIGGGSIAVTAVLVDTADYSLFNTARSIDTEKGERITAGFFNLELHGALTWSICPFFHLGAELAAPVFVSANGFEPYTSDFFTVNPGFRLRFIFGNLG